MQQSGSAIISLPPNMTEEEEANLSQSLSPSHSRGDNKLSTTIRDSYKPPYSAEVDEIPLDLTRSRSKIVSPTCSLMLLTSSYHDNNVGYVLNPSNTY
ncbi:hypothetical protein EON63_09340 [archaeon]|nr:MAG: hypothetical protein EON63_09340 [archaeon]